jgi:two-component system, OmpR family, response regulator
MPARVLLVDDEPGILEILGEILVTQGYTVATAANGPQALERLHSFPADVIILDIVMPGMSGNQMLATLRAQGVDVPAIAISGAPDRVGPGFLAVVDKPIDVERLMGLVETAIQRSGSAA